MEMRIQNESNKNKVKESYRICDDIYGLRCTNRYKQVTVMSGVLV